MVSKIGRGLRILLFFVIVTACGALPAYCYVPEGPHLIALMADVLSGPKRLRVVQQVRENVFQAQLADGANSDEGKLHNPGNVQEHESAAQASVRPLFLQHPLEWKETLSFIFPDRFRRDAWIQGVNRVGVINGEKKIQIDAGYILQWPTDRFNAYIVPLLYRRRFLIQRKLAERGVDFNLSSLGRFDNQLVYVIGDVFPARSGPQLWIDKHSFLPLRWIFPDRSGQQEQQDSGGQDNSFEIVYKGWKKQGGAWYPDLIEFYQGQRMVRAIQVIDILPDADFSEAIFDLDYLETVYKRRETEDIQKSGSEDQDMEEVQKAINSFHNKFKD